MVSIIVPVYNAASYIEETINSVVGQIYSDWELILVDDCSKDNSREIIKDYIKTHSNYRIILIEQKENAGAAAARNKGVDQAKGRYIAFLDADDLWREDKLDKEMQYMQKHDAGFVYTAYEFGNEKAQPTGKRVRVPKLLNYKDALSRTIIFTSTVLIDTEKISKDLCYMPNIPSEDTATWWQILKSGVIAYGLDQPLVIYRRPAHSLSSNKKVAIERIWNLYRNVAGMSAPIAAVYMLRWAWRASVRRIVDDTVRTHAETIKRFVIVQLSVIGVLLQTGLYAITWFHYLYPIVNAERYSQEGWYLGGGIKLYFRGHLLILTIYFIVLLFMYQTTGAMKTGYLKPGNIFSASIVSLLFTNTITYFQICLLRNWLIPVEHMAFMLVEQIVLSAAWSIVADFLYRNVFPPRETLVVSLGNKEEAVDVVERFNSRRDRFTVMKVLQYEGDIEVILKECLRWYGCVVVIGQNNAMRMEITEFCYRHYIRVYYLPNISDLLIQGSEQMDLFDIPILELKEYSIRWEARVLKRVVDVIVGFIGILVCSLWLIANKPQKEICMGKDGKTFCYYNGVGSFINVLNGTMSVIGPAPTQVNLAKQQIEDNKQFFFRYRVKPGMTGFTQIYSKKETDIESKLKMDMYYIQHFSLLMDFKLMLQSLIQYKPN